MEVDNRVVSMMLVVDGVIDVDAVDAVYVDNAVGVDNGVDVNNAVDVVLLMLIKMPVRILLLKRSIQKLPPDKLVWRMIVVDNQGAPDPSGEVHPEEEIHPVQHFSQMILSQIPNSRVKECQRAQMSNAAQALSTSNDFSEDLWRDNETNYTFPSFQHPRLSTSSLGCSCDYRHDHQH